MRKILTKPFGEIEVDDSQELTFQNGLFGFEDKHKFFLLENPESPFVWLQSSEKSNLAFIMIHPLQFKDDYKLLLSKEDYNDIKIDNDKKEKQLLDFVIVTIPEDPSKMTANLQGPVIINIEEKIGKQTISTNQEYDVKYPILTGMQDSPSEELKTAGKES